MKGKLITFEGAEGSGKSTQIQLALNYLKEMHIPVVFVREPGGVKISEDIRQMLLDVENKDMNDPCETLLYMASRAQLVGEVIKPALEKGKIVLCDRFLDSTIAYQGYGRGVNVKLIKLLGEFATQKIQPHLTILFDIDAKLGLSRIINRAKDRIEQRDLTYHNRVRRGYLKLATLDKKRIKVIKADDSKEEIHETVKMYLNKFLQIHS